MLLCGVSKIISEDFGEVVIVPGSLCTAKIWIDIAPTDVTAPYPTGALADTVARLEAMGVSAIHAAEVAESAERAVLRKYVARALEVDVIREDEELELGEGGRGDRVG